MSRLTLHLVPEAVWLARDPGDAYGPDGWEREGFIHCTDGDREMVAVANRFYAADPRPFVALTVDLERTGSSWRFDDAERRYPHVYGPIDPGAVVEVRRMLRDEQGRFQAVGPSEDAG